MTWIAGADGCPSGWVRTALHLETRAVDVTICTSAADLLLRPPQPQLLCIDIPIGLPDSGARACDVEARRRLGWPRRASVFPPPLRPALAATSHDEASRISRVIDGRGVSVQAWNIFGKVREVDTWLRDDADAASRVVESHPEVCFWAWAGGRAMQHAKRTADGRRERAALVDAWLATDIVAHARRTITRSAAADDDILDAVATLWTAARFVAGRAETLGCGRPDSVGLAMRICC